MLDFDELDSLQEVLEPGLLEVLQTSRAPTGLADHCRERGLLTCQRLYEALGTGKLHRDYLDPFDGGEVYEDMVLLSTRLDPPVTRQLEILRIRDAWRLCREKVQEQQRQQEALQKEVLARRVQEETLKQAEAREAAVRAAAKAAEKRRGAMQRAQEASSAQAAEQRRQDLHRLVAQREAMALPTFRGWVVPRQRPQRSVEAMRSIAGLPPPASELSARISQLASVLSQRYWDTDEETARKHVLSQSAELPLENNTVGYSAVWGLEVREEAASSNHSVHLARAALPRNALVERCPLVHLAAGESQLGVLAPLALREEAGGASLPLGYACLYRRSAEAWNVLPFRDGDELCWLAARELQPGVELVAPLAWKQWLASAAGEDTGTAGSQVDGPALGSTRHGPSPIHRFGVFSTCPAQAGEVIDVCPVLHLADEAALLENYAMQFDVGGETMVVQALGQGALYNHRQWPQVDWLYDRETDTVVFVARQRIEPGEELFIDYGKVYFTSRGMAQTCRLDGLIWRE